MCKGFLGITLGKNVDNIYSLDLFFNVIIIGVIHWGNVISNFFFFSFAKYWHKQTFSYLD